MSAKNYSNKTQAGSSVESAKTSTFVLELLNLQKEFTRQMKYAFMTGGGQADLVVKPADYWQIKDGQFLPLILIKQLLTRLIIKILYPFKLI